MKHLKKQFAVHPALGLDALDRGAWMASIRRQIRACDWHDRNEAQDVGFRLLHPVERALWLKNGPCPGCPCEPWCDTPCSLRLRWWDDRMALLRRKMGK